MKTGLKQINDDYLISISSSSHETMISFVNQLGAKMVRKFTRQTRCTNRNQILQ